MLIKFIMKMKRRNMPTTKLLNNYKNSPSIHQITEELILNNGIASFL